MSIPFFQIDAFTNTPFTGNPAAVCMLEDPLASESMQQIALEMNCSETAFLSQRDDTTYDLRWFTPTHEVDLCGHATLASAQSLWTEGYAPTDETLQFDTASGQLMAEPTPDGGIRMDFPAETVTPANTPDGLAEALHTPPTGVYRNRMDVLVTVARAETVRDLQPDMDRLARIDARGIIVTAAANDGEADFVSRFFAPQVGVPEDPVTGSAHCALGPFWATKLKRRPLVGRQVSDRGGTVTVDVRDARVDLTGHAVTTLQGTLATLPDVHDPT